MALKFKLSLPRYIWTNNIFTYLKEFAIIYLDKRQITLNREQEHIYFIANPPTISPW